PSPRIIPDGRQLAYLTWNHPNMPWDGTELWVSTFDADGKPVNSQRVAGGLKESVYQPEWSPDNRLYFVSDRTGWWNIYRSNNGRAEAICPLEAEFGGPQWVFRQSHYGFASPRQIICILHNEGRHASCKTGHGDWTVRRDSNTLLWGSPTDPRHCC